MGIGHMVHVLDDFLLLESNYNTCKEKLDQFLILCADIGVPMSEEKTFLPSTTLTFLGYELDTIKMEVRLPIDKLQNCYSLITLCLQKTK